MSAKKASRKVTQAPARLAPKRAAFTEGPSLGDELTQRDLLYYNAPLTILVSYVETVSNIPNSLTTGGSNIV
jgi:hypothetical protein